MLHAANILGEEDSKNLTSFMPVQHFTLTSTLQIKGDLDSHLRLVFQVWISVLVFNYDIGVYSCDLLNFEKDPCAFDINKKYFVGQGGLFPENDPDPDYWDLCLEVHGVVKVPYTRIQKKIDFTKCFYRFPRNEVAAPTIPSEAASKFR